MSIRNSLLLTVLLTGCALPARLTHVPEKHENDVDAHVPEHIAPVVHNEPPVDPAPNHFSQRSCAAPPARDPRIRLTLYKPDTQADEWVTFSEIPAVAQGLLLTKRAALVACFESSNLDGNIHLRFEGNMEPSHQRTAGSLSARHVDCVTRVLSPLLKQIPTLDLWLDLYAGAPQQGANSESGSNKAMIKKFILEHEHEILGCHEQALPFFPDLTGRIAVKFIVSSIGDISIALVKSSTVAHCAVERCVLDVVERWSFPPPRDDGRIPIVTYPFIFPVSVDKTPDKAGPPKAPVTGDGHPPAVNPGLALLGTSSPLEIAKRWLEAARQGNIDHLRAASALPLQLRGFSLESGHQQAEACGVKPRTDGLVGVRQFDAEEGSSAHATTSKEFNELAACLLADDFFTDYIATSWLGNLENTLDRVVGVIEVVPFWNLSKRLQRHWPEVVALATDHTLVQAEMTDNNGVTLTALLATRTDEVGSQKVHAVLIHELFEE